MSDPTKIRGFRNVSTSHQAVFITEGGEAKIRQISPRRWQVLPRGGEACEVSGKQEAIEEARSIASGLTPSHLQGLQEKQRRLQSSLFTETPMKKSSTQIQREIDEVLARKPRVLSKSSHAHATRRDARVVRNGQGNFLDPPEYPSHEYHVQTDLRRRPENRGSMSLTHAVEEAPWLDPDTKRKAKELLDKWKTSRPALNSQRVQDWIHQVLGYFKNSYRNPSAGSQQWNVSKLIFDERDPVHNADDHAGVHRIRKFYPDFSPTEQDFAGAYWGKR